ncbi:MAG: hypothetical protein IJT94_01960 [Oscillibacter sp.]|nr:hypothetical protein [Oscillibacter sp.]
MSNQPHRTCVRMSEKEYQTLKKKSAEAGLSANAWLMRRLESSRPTVYREPDTSEALRFLDDVGEEVNAIAHDFNCGYGSPEQLRLAVSRLAEAYDRIRALRKEGYPYAP